MASHKPTVGFAGLGAMGGGMAKNLVKNGFSVTGFDVYQPLVDSFVEAGGKPAKTPKDAAAEADFFVSMVANKEQNASLLFDGEHCVSKGLGKGKTFILCSTTPPSFLQELRKRLDGEAGRPDIKLLDCPVSGGTIRAADGTLSIFSSGPDEDLDAAKAVLNCISSRPPTSSHTQAVFDHVQASDADSFMFSNRAPHMLKNDWHPYSALAIILKDTYIVTDTARGTLGDSFPAPLANTAHYTYLQGVQAGFMKDDDAKLVQLYLPASQGDLVGQMTKADVNMNSSHQISKETVADLLCGIHLAASVEGMAFCKHLGGIDRKLKYEIISKAAGWNAMFTKCIPGMLDKDSWSLADCAEAEEVGRKLSEAVEKCRKIGYPCPMAAAALQQFSFASLRDKKLTSLSRGDR
ncbi:hypothetical protein LTS00_007619 [Friedmanniomyces endolithicus]|nr:hypothetical protein LTS00_007619 [Friedmanniomyces endolithicus]